jgi:hypothetical protein
MEDLQEKLLNVFSQHCLPLSMLIPGTLSQTRSASCNGEAHRSQIDLWSTYGFLRFW